MDQVLNSNVKIVFQWRNDVAENEYTCPNCGLSLWVDGRPTNHLFVRKYVSAIGAYPCVCGECGEVMAFAKEEET